MKKIILAFIFTALNAHAVGGHDQGGGGDLCEDRIKIIRDDLKSWIQKGGSQSLTLRAGVNASQYSVDMLKQLDLAQVKCVSAGDAGYPIAVSGIAKTCRFDIVQNVSSITCDFKKFQAASDSDQYILIHHEYAGLAGIELPREGDSSYNTSSIKWSKSWR